MNMKIHLFTAMFVLFNGLSAIPDPVSHCGSGMCQLCYLEPISNISFCYQCWDSDIIKIDELRVRGGKCQGRNPISNCARVTFTAKFEKICISCQPKYKISFNQKSCEKIGIDKCLTGTTSTICESCEVGFWPNENHTKCEPNNSKIEGCVAYKRENGELQCNLCGWRHYPISDIECGLRDVHAESIKCSQQSDWIEYPNGKSSCHTGCNNYGGYFSNGTAASSRNRVLGGENLVLQHEISPSYV